jgi:hypothetical protein
MDSCSRAPGLYNQSGLQDHSLFPVGRTGYKADSVFILARKFSDAKIFSTQSFFLIEPYHGLNEMLRGLNLSW